MGNIPKPHHVQKTSYCALDRNSYHLKNYRLVVSKHRIQMLFVFWELKPLARLIWLITNLITIYVWIFKYGYVVIYEYTKIYHISYIYIYLFKYITLTSSPGPHGVCYPSGPDSRLFGGHRRLLKRCYPESQGDGASCGNEGNMQISPAEILLWLT